MRNFTRLCLAGVAVASATLLLSGCVQPAPVVTPATTSSGKPLFASDEEALAAAAKSYAAYLQMSDLITSEGGANPDRIADFVSANQLDKELDGLLLFRKEQISTRGASAYDKVSIEKNELLNNGSQEVTIYVCSDASGVRVINEQGVDVTPDSRPNRQPFELTFQSTKPGDKKLVLERSEVWNGKDFC